MNKLILLLFISSIFCQGPWMMNDRTHSELDWTTMKTDYFNIHYHNGIEDIAIKGATIAEQVIPTLMKQMGLETLPILDVIFTNEEFTRTLFEKREMNVIPVVLKDREKFSGTNIRKLILDGKDWQDLVPHGTKKVLDKINAKERLKNL